MPRMQAEPSTARSANSSKLRVLHLNAGNLFGGVESLLLTLACFRQEMSSIENEFAICFRDRFFQDLEATGAVVHDLGPVSVRKLWTVARARKALERLLQAARHDIVICHSPWCLAIFSPVARHNHVPVVLWVHGELHGRHWIERWARRHPPGFAICNSRFTQSTLPAIFPALLSQVVYCPVSPRLSDRLPHAWSRIRMELNTPADAIVFLQASRLEEWKGHRVLLQAMSRLGSNANWIAWFAGGVQRPAEQKYLNHLQALARDYGIAQRVRFLGQRSDVALLMSAADVYCQPNTEPEPFGMALVEALYAGLPVVTSAMGGAQEIVDTTCGILVPPGDTTALAEALRSLMQDALLRTRLGNAGPARALHISDPGRRLKQLEGTLRSLFS
ncbi:MAG TPA: glycosyltransferase, partial [Terriglobales bacterium]|nr:glycosyltransferase [Terriglobales bacterium]